MQLKEYDQPETFAPVTCKDYSHLQGRALAHLMHADA